jgi:hypothetical protein
MENKNQEIVKIELTIPKEFVEDIQSYTTSFPYFDSVQQFFLESARVAIQKLKDTQPIQPEQQLLEGAQGYALRIAKIIESGRAKTTRDIVDVINSDVARINGSLAHHHFQSLRIAGWTTGLFEDKKADVTT